MLADRCQFRTTKPKGALSQSVRVGSVTRYEQCKNRATDSIPIADVRLTRTTIHAVKCCALHKRLHEERGWLP